VGDQSGRLSRHQRQSSCAADVRRQAL